ncbi:PspC domain-containing protein [Pontibacillus marinus]|uniref:Phage shock protein PspC N-terminal domain-containing protein n=1 Tax=Pontibacillus marinus BH030004 = DSM 16465 TaxID=1385511 RepID=A0A0A5GF37_9BACI|nr:PspC domain-containing protein [Pontibacillus marinus]KGX90599.1 hypothetical protein N783_19775 [Pontibacillus marinus BH030004 = DSM 16465]
MGYKEPLVRSNELEGAWLFGICAGLSRRYKWLDLTYLRGFFLFCLLFGGASLYLYILLILLIPHASNPGKMNKSLEVILKVLGRLIVRIALGLTIAFIYVGIGVSLVSSLSHFTALSMIIAAIWIIGAFPLIMFTPAKYALIVTAAAGLADIGRGVAEELGGDVASEAAATVVEDDELLTEGFQELEAESPIEQSSLTEDVFSSQEEQPIVEQETIHTVLQENDQQDWINQMFAENGESDLASSEQPYQSDLDQDGMDDSIIPPDVDGDGMREGVTDQKLDYDGDGLDDREYGVDADGDGLRDGELDPSVDSDQDGISDDIIPADNDGDGLRNNELNRYLNQ